METVEIRCPVGPQRLLMKLKLGDVTPHYTSDNLMEIACSDCRTALRRKRRLVSLVLHYYNFLGEVVKTEVHAVPPSSDDNKGR